MGQRRARQAQVWAVRMAAELDLFISRARPDFPMDLKNYPVVVQGQAIRHCQEVNLAKKQLDHLQEQTGKQKGLNWALKYRLIDPARQPGDLTDYRPRAVLYVDWARGRKVQTNPELEMNVDAFIAGLQAQLPPQPRQVLEPIEVPQATMTQNPPIDPQEDLINRIYGIKD